MIDRKIIITKDNVKLQVIDIGNGQPVILLHGFSQTAEMFKYQIEAFKSKYRVIAYDMRGHGLSEKPDYGYRISRLAGDLNDLINSMRLQNVILLGHSMGCAVIWSYIDLFGHENLSKLIFVDQQASMTINPAWSKEEKEISGATLTHDLLYAVSNAFSGENAVDISKKFIRGRFTAGIDEKTMDWVIEQNLQLPREYAGKLLLNHMSQDWRDVIKRINIPTLIITGLASDKSIKSQKWIKDCIPQSELVVFSKEESGSHFMFIENAEKFNNEVISFIDSK